MSIRLWFFAFAIAAAGFIPAAARGADWAFRPSYFSHGVPEELAGAYPTPHSLSAYRPAIISPYPGFAINGVQRFNRVLIQNGNSVDYTILRSGSVRVQP